MPTAPTPVTRYATPPNSNDTANFDARADAKVADDVVKVGEYNALAANVFGNAVEAAASATAAAASKADAEAAQLQAQAFANAAGASAGATAWVSGATYAAGQRVWSVLKPRQIFARLSAGAGTTDPSADSVNWQLIYIEPELVTAESFFF
jgi:hypothetical protein